MDVSALLLRLLTILLDGSPFPAWLKDLAMREIRQILTGEAVAAIEKEILDFIIAQLKALDAQASNPTAKQLLDAIIAALTGNPSLLAAL